MTPNGGQHPGDFGGAESVEQEANSDAAKRGPPEGGTDRPPDRVWSNLVHLDADFSPGVIDHAQQSIEVLVAGVEELESLGVGHLELGTAGDFHQQALGF
jgi:hypothetical protein